MITFIYGILAGIGSAISFGSFGVPIKCKQIMDAKVHPFVYQIYKSSVCFLTSFIVLAWNWPAKFTWWGTVGAAIWVLNGVCAIMAIQKCGLGIAQTTYSALSIFVAFIWGAFIFHEDIKSLPMAVVGLVLMAIGFAGLGYAAQRALMLAKRVAPTDEAAAVEAAKVEGIISKVVDVPLIPEPASSTDHEHANGDKSSGATNGHAVAAQASHSHGSTDAMDGARELEEAESGAKLVDSTVPGAAAVNQKGKWDYMIGVALACFIGLLNGSLSVPFKYAQKEVKGIVYILSFGIGVAIVTSGAAVVFFGLLAAFGRRLPRMQFRKASGPACLTGLLWSIGNFLSIYAVQYCGISLGWPLVQCQLVVSSTWALLYYKEMPGWISILIFIASVVIILIGVFILAFFGTGTAAGSH
ncbi:hypothetical protein CVIRNUC_001874 [Coccomyxa viridis]|uniref:EamA domain-containing protein n=1 Tax=Coccomyxa viridis TaxID=1274662 RepID=A0AAV1HUW0_9CHLO|nr:hypothetical protein CVIRNUC_001874 [Coccomyxa viridis]